MQQARNASIWAEEQGIPMRSVLHDRDAKFPASFDGCFTAAGVQIVKTPVAAPNANAYAESWIGHFKRECLNRFVCFSLGHLDHIAQSFVLFHNQYRPHQGKGNVPLPVALQPPSTSPPLPADAPAGKVLRQRFLGGLLNHYYRAAA